MSMGPKRRKTVISPRPRYFSLVWHQNKTAKKAIQAAVYGYKLVTNVDRLFMVGGLVRWSNDYSVNSSFDYISLVESLIDLMNDMLKLLAIWGQGTCLHGVTEPISVALQSQYNAFKFCFIRALKKSHAPIKRCTINSSFVLDVSSTVDTSSFVWLSAENDLT